MKLLSYKMLCAMDDADYITAGSIMAEHFCVPGIAELTSSLSPALNTLGPGATLKYAIIVAHRNTKYYWYSTSGFGGPVDAGALYGNYQAFDVWVRR